MTTAYDFTMKQIDGQQMSLGELRGKVVMFVNVASRCGFTPQYTALEKLHQDMKAKNVVVIGVPCNQFGEQEPGTDKEIHTFCSTKYQVTFPLMAKVDVNGDAAHPFFKWLTSKSGGNVKWNFTKFVIGKDGNFVKRFESSVTPDHADVKAVITTALAAA
jgi:glutathione peroxidase